MVRRSAIQLVVLATCLLALPAIARAQSTIAGVVRDTSGAVLPGVTVEASSDVLIEKTRAVTTDGSGQYKIVDLRPGTYTVTFSLPGFQTIKRDQVQLPADFTATINSDMKVGALEETITVTTAAPVVDVQSAAHVQTLDREAIDNLPSGRTIQGIGQMIVGVSLSLPDVGGSRAAMQTYMSVRGNSAANNTVMVDGMVVNGLEANGAVQSYFNDAMSQEMSYQTSGIDASVSSGGVRLNMIPKDGGNRFNGSAQYSIRPGQWQGDNLTDRLKLAGLTNSNNTNYISDLSGSQGGPIMRDRVWFFAAARDNRTENGITNTVFDDGTQGSDYNYIRDALGRVTYQLSSKNKISGYYDRVSKFRGHDMQGLTDPETASLIWTSPNYSTGQIRYTSTLSSRLLLDGGWAFNVERRDTNMQPGVEGERNTPEWFGNTSKAVTGVTLGSSARAPITAGSEWPERASYNFSLSYVTGSHNIKGGFNGTYGKFYHEVRANGDLTQNYAQLDSKAYLATGAPLVFIGPQTVTVRNTPRQSQENLNKDIGFFVQDSWTLRRLTVNAGIRYEMLNAGVEAGTSPAGRFVPERTFAGVDGKPDWNDWAPRFSAVYDLFGNSKTALKYSVNRYNAGETTTVASGFNPFGTKSATLTWTDVNNDDIAQGGVTFDPSQVTAANPAGRVDCVYLSAGCEINFATLAKNFGLLSDVTTGIYPRQYSIEHGVEIQHELLPRLSLTAGYYHGDFNNLTTTINRAVTPADYTAVSIFDPTSGKPFDVYNQSAAAAARSADNYTFVDPDRKNVFNSYSLDFRSRLSKGATFGGGMSWERQRSNGASSTSNCTIGRLQDPNFLRLCDDFNLEDGTSVPYSKHLKLNGTYQLPYSLLLSGSFQSIAGGAVAQTYSVTKGSTKYPDGSSTYLIANQPAPACPAPCVAGAVVLPASFTQATITPRLRGSNVVLGERLNQLDLKVGRTFKFNSVTVMPNFEAFNVNNSDKVITYGSTSYATSTYLKPNSVVQGRILGVGAQVKW